MKKAQKILLTIVLALILVFAYTINVNATDFSFDDLLTDDVILVQGDTFTLGYEELVGESGSITLNDGKISIHAELGSSGYDLTIKLYDNADAVINTDKSVNMTGSGIGKVDITIDEGSTLTINGTLIVPTSNTPTFTNNGTVTINEGGVLEIRAQATYTDNGTTNVYGTLVMFGDKVSSNPNLYETGKIYSKADVEGNITIPNDTEEYTYSLKTENNVSFTSSVTTSASMSDAYLYTLSKEEVEIPEEPVEEEPTDDPIVDDETVVATEDETTDEDDETVTTTEDETTENPSTGDEIAMFATIFIVSIVGLAITIMAKKKIK